MEDNELQHPVPTLYKSDHVAAGVQVQHTTDWNLSHPQELAVRHRYPLSIDLTPRGPSDSDTTQDESLEAHHWEAPSPSQILSSSEVDPFASIPVDLPSSTLAQLIDQSAYKQPEKSNS